MVIINNFDEYKAFEGKEIGVSDWHTITQEQINRFADATIDHQWIHTDPEKAKKEGPFKNTIAHGYLTLSMIPHLWDQIAEVRNIKMLINYGIENLRFGQPVLVDSDVRLKAKLKSITYLRGIAKVVIAATFEIQDNPKPAYTAAVVFLYHFND